jgi:hypothetical protein
VTERTIPSQGTGARTKRPLGVWLLTIYYGLFAGLFPLIAVLVAFFNEEGRAILGLSEVDLGLSVLLAVAILVSAVGAWRGNNVARIVFVVLLFLHYGLLVVSNFRLSTVEGLSESMQMTAAGRGIRFIIHIGINVWYFFLSGRPTAFYRRTGAKLQPKAGLAPGDGLSPDDHARYEAIVSFVKSLQAVEELPPGRYAMWWAADDAERFQDSPCFRSWDAVYRALDGIESWVMAMLVGAVRPGEVKSTRLAYPATPIQFFVQGPEQQDFVLSLSQEKGVRFHFNPEQCEPAYRDRFVASFAAFARALRFLVEQQASELDPDREPKALNWWNASKVVLPHLEEEGDPARFFGVLLLGDGESQSG